MAWSDPLGDLRRYLADSSSDNLVKQKKVLGPVSGQNRTFFTFDDRLQAPAGNQSGAANPLRVWFGNAEVAASGITVTDTIRGEFQLSFAPSGLQKITASYYYEQSLDSELQFDMQQAAYQMNVTTIDQVPEGLQIGALQAAASMAHARLATRWQQRKSAQFTLEDEPAASDMQQRIAFHQEESTRQLDLALKTRAAFYGLRMDRGRSAAYGVLEHRFRPYTPRQ